MLAAGLLVSLVFTPFTLARNVPQSNLVPRSQLSAIPSGFSPHARAPHDDHLLRLTIGLPSDNVGALHAALLDVSEPSSPNYGRHLSKAEVRRIRVAFVHPRGTLDRLNATILGGQACFSEGRQRQSNHRLARKAWPLAGLALVLWRDANRSRSCGARERHARC